MDRPSFSSRRAFLRLTTVVGAGLLAAPLLSACGAGSPATTAASSTAAKSAATSAAASASGGATPAPTAIPVKAGQTLIEFWSSFDPNSQNKTGITAIMQMINDFQAKNDKIVVQNIHVDYSNQLADKLLTAIAAGEPPNSYYADRFLTATWAHKGIFTDLTPLNSKAGISADQYLPFAWAEATWQGKQWVLPFDTDIRMLYINNQAAQQAGMDLTKPPQTTQDLMDWTEKMTKADAQGNIQQLGYWPTIGNCFHEIWCKNFGGEFYDEKADTCTANTQPNVDAFTYMQTYAKRWGQTNVDTFMGSQPKQTNQTYFYTGKVASWVNGDWDLATIKQYVPDLQFTLTPIPSPNGPGSSMAGGWSLTVPKGAKHLDEGYSWVNYATGKEGLLTYCLGTAHIPTLKAVADDPKMRADPIHNKFFDQLPKAWNRPVTIEAQTLWNEMGTAQKNVMQQKMDPKPAMDQIVQHVNEQLKLDKSQ